MPRKKVELSDTFPYHVCARSNNKEWFELPLARVFGIYANVIEKTIDKYCIELHSFVLMANHFHMLVSTPMGNLSRAMRYFMTESSRAIARCSDRINRIYGSRYHWTIIRDSQHFAHAFRYVYKNPVTAGIVDRAEQYDWSTLNQGHCKFQKMITSVRNGLDEYIPNERNDLLIWLNKADNDEYIEMVKKALKKHEFRFGLDPNTGKRPLYFDKLHPKNTPGT